MTTLEAYHLIREWLARPGATKCTDEMGYCVYDNGKGNHCAIGGPMRNEPWIRELSSYTDILALALEDPRVAAFWGEADRYFLKEAQQAHDQSPGADNASYLRESWQNNALAELDRVARHYSLI